MGKVKFFPTHVPKCFSFSSISGSTSDHSTSTLVSSVVSVLTEQRSKSRWNFLRSIYPSGFKPTEFSQIILKIRNNPRLALRFFLWTQSKSLCNHDLFSYSTIIHILARGRLKPQALDLIRTAMLVSEPKSDDHLSEIDSKPPKIFETLVRTYRSCDSAPFVFDLLIEACLQSNRIDQSISIVRMLRSRGIYPNVGTCNSLIQSVSRSKGCDVGFDMYREVFGLDADGEGNIGKLRVYPNVQTFNLLMLSFYQKGLMENVEEVWAEMEKLTCAANVYSYSVLVAAFCEQGKMDEAEKLWVEMETKQMKPDAIAYNTLIGGYCKIGEIERAEELFREMAFSGVESTCATYEHLIKGYCKIKDVDLALLLYKDMRRKGFSPAGCVNDAVIRGVCDKSGFFEALRFMRGVMGSLDSLLSGKSCEFLIKGLCEEGNMEEALKLQALMVGKGFEPNVGIYGAFIDGYMKQGNVELARKLGDEMSQMLIQQDDK